MNNGKAQGLLVLVLALTHLVGARVRHPRRAAARVIGVVVAVLIGAGLLAPQATATPAFESVDAAVAVVGAPAAVPADIWSDGLDWAKEKARDLGNAAKDAGSWLKDKGSSFAGAVKEKLKSAAGTVKDIAKAPVEAANSVARGWVQERLEEVATWAAQQLGRAASWMLIMVLSLAFSLTSPDLDAGFMLTWAGRVFALAVPITFTVALGQVLWDVLRGRGLTGVRWAVWGALVSAFASMVTLPLLAVASRGMDVVRDQFIGWVETDTDKLAQRITDIWSTETWQSFSEDNPAAGAAISAGSVSWMLLIFVLFCFFVLLGGLGLVMVMLFREQLLAGASVMTPVAYSGLASRPTRGWPRTILAWILALLVSPVAILVILGLGISILVETDPAGDMSQLLQQMGLCFTMLLSSMSMPLVSYKLFSFLGESAVSAMTDEAGESVKSGAETVGSTVSTVAAAALAAGAAVGTGGASAGASGGAASGSAAGGAESGAAGAGETAAGSGGTSGPGASGAGAGRGAHGSRAGGGTGSGAGTGTGGQPAGGGSPTTAGPGTGSGGGAPSGSGGGDAAGSGGPGSSGGPGGAGPADPGSGDAGSGPGGGVPSGGGGDHGSWPESPTLGDDDDPGRHDSAPVSHGSWDTDALGGDDGVDEDYSWYSGWEEA